MEQLGDGQWKCYGCAGVFDEVECPPWECEDGKQFCDDCFEGLEVDDTLETEARDGES